MEGLDLDEEKFKSIARLPARIVLEGQLAGVIASPLTGLVRGLGSMISGLALQLGQIAEQGLVSGEPPKDDSSDGSAAGPVAEEGTPSSQATDDVPSSTPPADDASEAEQPQDDAPAEEQGQDDSPVEAPAAGQDESKEAEGEPAEGETDGASDEVAEQDDQGGQDGGASAGDSGSEAEQSPDDSSETDKKEEE